MLLANSISLINRDDIQALQIDNSFATAEIALFGGHILSFCPKKDNRERLWVSKEAIFNGQKAIRGGVPICWPWFGEHPSDKTVPSHGYVRQQSWKVIATEDSESGTTIELQPITSNGEGFDAYAQLTLVVKIGEQLSIQLKTTNLGEKPLSYNCALHSYFTIEDIRQCKLLGLKGTYEDKTRNYKSFETPQPYQFTEETDRVHFDKPEKLTIIDKQLKTDVISSGHDSIVVWNPWQEKSISMGDMADDSYVTMLCVESTITQGQMVAPKETHTLQQIIA
ncbi:D-hexose-6-phosphate mutarotase [Paraglaciecola sp.]|uniref:D-hexose-6-phosphate mutarotase n=1 Tax=Paraglaciecola sp. TaxID=1920173 RepID=UPI003264BEFF